MELEAADIITILRSESFTEITKSIVNNIMDNTVIPRVMPKIQKMIDELKPKDLILEEPFPSLPPVGYSNITPPTDKTSETTKT